MHGRCSEPAGNLGGAEIPRDRQYRASSPGSAPASLACTLSIRRNTHSFKSTYNKSNGEHRKRDDKSGNNIYVDVSYYISMIYCIYVGKRGITRTRNRTLGLSTIENRVLYFSAYYKMNQLKPIVYIQYIHNRF